MKLLDKVTQQQFIDAVNKMNDMLNNINQNQKVLEEHLITVMENQKELYDEFKNTQR